jgi:hypothetical protein
MEPAPIGRRLLSLGVGPSLAGDHDGAPPGFLFVVGPEIRPGGALVRVPITEVVPIALHLLGLPIARDFDGSILEQALLPGGRLDRPAVVIETYGVREPGDPSPAAVPAR